MTTQTTPLSPPRGPLRAQDKVGIAPELVCVSFPLELFTILLILSLKTPQNTCTCMFVAFFVDGGRDGCGKYEKSGVLALAGVGYFDAPTKTERDFSPFHPTLP